MRFPRERPPNSTRFDLIIISEVGYYWSLDELNAAQGAIDEQLEIDGHLVLVHWAPPVSDYRGPPVLLQPDLPGDVESADIARNFDTVVVALGSCTACGVKSSDHRLLLLPMVV